jgi:hypothetical protein
MGRWTLRVATPLLGIRPSHRERREKRVESIFNHK